MATLIVYMTRHSTTQKVAEIIRRGLVTDKVDVVNIGKSSVPDLGLYSDIIIGGSIHMGMIQKKIKKFCTDNTDILQTKKIGLFMCYMEVEKGIEEFETNFPEELRKHATAQGLLGGEFLFEKMNFFEKLIVKKTANIGGSVSKLKSEAINEFIDQMNN